MKRIDIRIATTLDDKGLASAVKSLRELEKMGSTTSRAQAQQASAAAKIAQAHARAATAAAKVAVADNQAAASAQRLAQAQSRSAQGAATAATAQQRYQAELAKTARAQDQAAAAATRRAASEARASRGGAGGDRALPRTFAGVTKAGAAQLGAAAAAVSLVDLGKDAIQMVARLDTAKRSLEALAGSPKLYAEALQQATAQQKLFGGSLEENISGIQGLITVSRSSGVELAKLLDITQRLSIKDPAQGIAGARIALNEALAGDPVSLAKRYEIPRAALKALRDESSSAAEKLAVVDKYLTGIGITSEVASGSVSPMAIRLNELAAAAEQAQLGLGLLLTGPLAGATKAFTDLFSWVGAGLTVFSTTDERVAQLGATLAAGATTYAEYQNQVRGAADQLRGMGIAFDPLNEAQFAFVQGLIASGMAAGEAVAQMQQLGSGADLIVNGLDQLQATTGAADTEIAGLAQRMLTIATSSASGEVAIMHLADALVMGSIDSDSLRAALAALEEETRIAANAAALQAQREEERTTGTRDATDATVGLTAALIEETAAKLDEASASDLATTTQQAMNDALEMALLRHNDAAGAAGMLASMFGISEAAAHNAAAAYYAARDAAAAFALVSGGLSTFQNAAGLANQRSGERGGSGSAGVDAAQARAQTARNRALAIPIAAAEKRAKAGGAARISEAEKTADRLVEIEQDAARRLMEIDAKLAADRLAAQQRLAQTLLEGANQTAVANETNDLDFFGKDLSDDQKTKLADRERAEAEAKSRQQANIEEARRIAGEGDATLAEATYQARQEQNQQLQDLDETYYAKQREVGKDQQGALTQQYQEGVDAIAGQTDDKIALAQAEAQARVQAVADERQAVLTAAADQATALGATGAAATTAAGQVEALAGELRALPTNVTTTVTVRTVRAGEGAPATGGTRAAGGGTFLTAGPTTLTVGDNPGGIEAVSVTPLSGRGRTRVGGGMLHLAGGGTVVDAGADAAQRRLGGGTTPTFPSASKRASGGAAAGAGVADAKDALEAEQQALQLLLEIADLRERIGQVASEGAFDSNGAFANALRRLGDEAQFAAKVVKYRLLPLTDETAEDMNRYADVASGAIGVLGDTLDLRERLLGGTLDASSFGDKSDYANAIRRLGDEANFIARVVRYRLVPLTDVQAEAIGRYSDAVSSSVSALKDTLDLQASAFADYTPPSAAQLTGLADDANRIVAAVSRAAATYDTKGLEAAQKFSDALGATVGAFTDTLKFNEGLLFTEAVAPDPAKLKQFAAGASAILGVTDGLARQAQAIPAGGLAALQTATAAITAQAEALIRMAAVPFADLPRISGAFGAAGSGSVGGGGPTINIYNPPANLNVPALIAQIKTGLQQDVAARR